MHFEPASSSYNRLLSRNEPNIALTMMEVSLWDEINDSVVLWNLIPKSKGEKPETRAFLSPFGSNQNVVVASNQCQGENFLGLCTYKIISDLT